MKFILEGGERSRRPQEDVYHPLPPAAGSWDFGHFNLLTVRVNWPVVVGLQRGGLQHLRDGQLGQVGVRGRTQSGRCI